MEERQQLQQQVVFATSDLYVNHMLITFTHTICREFIIKPSTETKPAQEEVDQGQNIERVRTPPQ